MDELSPDMTEALAASGIDASSIDDGSLDLSQFESVEQEAPAESEVAHEGAEEVVGEVATEGAEAVKTEGEETKEAPIEEPKLTAKEFQEIYAAKQELELKEKAFTERMQSQESEFKTQYQEKLTEYDKFDSFLASLAQKDPDLFGVLQSEYQEHTKHYANPVVDKVSKEVAELRKELSQFKSKASDEVTLTKLSSAMNELKAGLGKEAEALKIKVDYNAIEDMWAKGIEPKEAFYAKYGESLHKAALSRAKVEIATKKVEAQPKVATAGNVNRSNVSKGASYKDMSWDQAMGAALKSVLGKA